MKYGGFANPVALAASLQTLEAGTVTFSLARLPRRKSRLLLILKTSYAMDCHLEMVRKYWPLFSVCEADARCE